MVEKVDGGGTCVNSPAGDSRHSWRYSYMYQVPAEQSPIAGAPVAQNETRHMYYCIHCLEERSAPTRVPVVPGLINNIQFLTAAPASARPPLLS